MARLWIVGPSGHMDAHPLDVPEWRGEGIRLVQAPAPGGSEWLLCADRGHVVFVNGEPVPLGIRALDSRDEIRLDDGTRLVFSAECAAIIAPVPADAGSAQCARCTGALESGSPGVRCPACRTWFHEYGEFTCWSSASACSVCGLETAKAASEWTPEEC
jgi:hypothetical protein